MRCIATSTKASPAGRRGESYTTASAIAPRSPSQRAVTPQTRAIVASAQRLAGRAVGDQRAAVASTSTRSAWFIACGEIVEHQHHARARRRLLAQAGDQRGGVGEIEIGQRLVGEQPARPGRQHPRHQRPRALAARQPR